MFLVWGDIIYYIVGRFRDQAREKPSPSMVVPPNPRRASGVRSSTPAGLVPCFCWYTRLCRVDLDCNRGFEYVLVYRMLMFFRYRVLTMSYHENTQASIDYVCWKQGSVERKGQALAPNRPEARDKELLKRLPRAGTLHKSSKKALKKSRKETLAELVWRHEKTDPSNYTAWEKTKRGENGTAGAKETVPGSS